MAEHLLGWPIRIAVRIDFSDGSEHNYDVRAEDAVALPLGAAFWAEGVVTSDMAKRMEHDRRRQEEIAAAKTARDETVKLLERALHLYQDGEFAPGGTETLHGWARETEGYLRSLLPPETVE